jgi:hypothetical protein
LECIRRARYDHAIDPGESSTTPLQPAAIPILRFRPVSIHILRRERPAHNKHSSITVTPHFVIATQPCGRLLQISISHRPVSIVYERARASFALCHFLRAQNKTPAACNHAGNNFSTSDG